MASRRQMMLLLVIALAYKFYAIPLRYIAASLLIFDRKFYSSTWLTGSNLDAISTLAKSDNYKNTTTTTTTANTIASENASDDASTMISIHRPKSCTAEQIERIYERLPDYEDYCRTGKDPWINNCPISIITGCPETTWLDEYYISVSDPELQSKFLAINVGCNKGYDAIHFLRMGSLNPVFAKKTWSDAMPRDTMGPNCGQNTESDILSSSNSMSTGTNLIHGDMRVYCIEPMPSTFQALQNASNITGWAENLKIIHAAINNEDPSSLFFPKPSIDNLGYEKHTIGTRCPETGEGCVPVETKRLDDLMRDENLLGQRVHVLLIDVEGYDFEVLLGGNITLHDTEYVEFEFNWRGKWGEYFQSGEQPLKSAISYLDNIGFTCYFPGKQGELWRITDCWQDHYSGIFWSNVACVHRDLAPALLQHMEQRFLNITTMRTKMTTDDSTSVSLYAQPIFNVTHYQKHSPSRYDEINLVDPDGKSRYKLGIKDRTMIGTTEYATCVWADIPPIIQAMNVRRIQKMIQHVAYQYNCIRMIGILERPPNIDVSTMMRELHHTVYTISQAGMFLGLKRRLRMQNAQEVFWIWNATI